MKWLQRFCPSQESLQNNWLLRYLNPWLKQSPNYWKFNLASVSRGVSIGLFNSFMPMPFQSIIALLLALVCRGNILLALGFLWVNNPITMIPMYLFAYKTGAFILHEPTHLINMHLSWEWITQKLFLVWKPFLLGCLVDGVVLGALGYFAVVLFWKKLQPRFEQKTPTPTNNTQEPDSTV